MTLSDYKIDLSAFYIIGFLPGKRFGCSAFSCVWGIGNLWSIFPFMPVLPRRILGFA